VCGQQNGAVMTRKEAVLPIDSIKPNPRNARTHSKKQIRKLANSIEHNGFGSSALVDENHVLIGGGARVKAFKLLGKTEIPVTILEGLTPVQKKALALAENRVGLDSGWDRQVLLLEMSEIEIGPRLTQTRPEPQLPSLGTARSDRR